MRKIISPDFGILLLLLLLSDQLSGQANWLWAISGGGSGDDQITTAASCADAQGNVYYTGYYTGSATISGTTLNAAGGAGDQDIFVCKFDRNGNKTWVVSAGGTGNDAGKGIGVDGSGNVYVSGYFYSASVTFNGTTVTNAGGGFRDVLFLKFTSTGSASLVKSFGSTSDDQSSSMAVTTSGDCYLSGTFGGTVTFGTASVTSQGSSDIFTAKLNASGAVQWAKGGGGASGDNGNGISLDAAGSYVYTTGYIQGTAAFGSLASVTSAGGTDVCIVKYSASTGTENWVRLAGGTGTDAGSGIVTLSDGSVAVTGAFQGTAAFGAAGSVSSAGAGDIFVALYNSSGTAVWVQRAGGSGDDSGNALAADVNNNIYVTGGFRNSITFGTLTALTSAGGADIFAAVFNNSGTALLSVKAGSPLDDAGTSVAVDAVNRVFLGGYYQGTVSFGSISRTSAGVADAFLSRLNIGYSWTGTAGTVWNAGSNWSPAMIPGAEDDVTISAGKTNYPVISANTSLRNLTISGGPASGSVLTIGTGNTLTCSGTHSITAGSVGGSGTLSLGTSGAPCAAVTIGTSSGGPVFGCTVYVNTNAVTALLSTTFNGTTTIKDNNASANTNIGANTFAGATTIEAAGAAMVGLSGALSGNTYNNSITFINSGSGGLYTSHAFGETYNSNGTITFTNTGTGGIYPSASGATVYNKNIIVNCTAWNGSNNGIAFGDNTGTTTFAAGISLTVGTTGFTIGQLILKRVAHNGNANCAGPGLNLTFTNKGRIVFGPSSQFDVPVTTTSPQVNLNGAIFNCTVNITKNGTNNNASAGGNEFNGDVFIANTSTAVMTLADTRGDTYNGNVTFSNTSTGTIYPASSGDNYFRKDITATGIGAFGNGGGVVIMDGAADQHVQGGGSPDIKNLTIGKSAGNVYLTIPVSVSTGLTFSAGANSRIMNADTSLLTIRAGAMVTGNGPNAFVSGPVKKIGNTAFIFPLGKSGAYMPLGISAPATVSDAFQAEYFATAPATGTYAPFKDLSNCEYWNVQRTSGSSSVSVTLNWNSTGCSPINASVLGIAVNSGTGWMGVTPSGLTGSDASGSITSAPLSSFGQFTFGYNSLLMLDTRQVNEANFTINSGADLLPANFVSGPTGTPGGTRTLMAAANNTPGVLILHPDLPASPLDITINALQADRYHDMEIKLEVDNSGNITSVRTGYQGSFYDMASDYYTISSIGGANAGIAFDKVRNTTPALAITTNLPDGITFDMSAVSSFQISVPGSGFGGYTLKVFSRSDQTNPVYSSTVTPGNPIAWNGMNGGSPFPEGVYRFELGIESGGSTYVYYGQLILKH